MNVGQIGKAILAGMKKYAPSILTGVGIGGMLGGTVLACSETPKALEQIKKQEKVKDKIFEGVKAYWPAALVEAASITCIIFANNVSLKRQAAALAAATLSDTRLKEYREAVRKKFGDKKAEEVKDQVAKDILQNKPINEQTVIYTGNGDHWCFDAVGGRPFKSSIEKVRQAVNNLNKKLLIEGSASLNDFYDELGLKPSKSGDILGWNASTSGDLLEVDFSSQLTEDGIPCLVLDYSVAPTYWGD